MLYRGGGRAGKGTYWALRDGARVDLAPGEALPDTGSSGYIKAPAALMLTVGNLLGLLYVLALPVIAMAMALAIAGRKAAGGALAYSGRGLSFGWRPSMAYFAGRKKRKAPPDGRRQ